MHGKIFLYRIEKDIFLMIKKIIRQELTMNHDRNHNFYKNAQENKLKNEKVIF